MTSGSRPTVPTSPSRRRAARLLRELGHAFLRHDVDDRALDRMSAQIHIPLADLTEAPLRADGAVSGHSDQCFVTGDASPIGSAAKVSIDGKEVVLRVRIPVTFQGEPGFVHSGAVAAIFQDIFALSTELLQQLPALPTRSEIEFVAAIPIGRDIEFRARLAADDGTDFQVDAVAMLGTDVMAQAVGRMRARTT
jgi:hypothetical protein